METYNKKSHYENIFITLLATFLIVSTSSVYCQKFDGNASNLNEDLLIINRDQNVPSGRTDVTSGLRILSTNYGWNMFVEDDKAIKWSRSLPTYSDQYTQKIMKLTNTGILNIYTTDKQNTNDDNLQIPSVMLRKSETDALGLSLKQEDNEFRIGFVDTGHNFLAYSSYHYTPERRKFVVPAGTLIVGTDAGSPGNIQVKGSIDAESYTLKGAALQSSQWTTKDSDINFQGNVAIGKQTPTAKLDVNGTINAIRFTLNGQDINVGGSSDWTKTNNKLNYSSGNVGVGNSNPTSLLEIGTGNASATTRLLTVHGGATFNNNATDENNKTLTTQVSINTNKKIQNAALTVAGTTFIGSWGELETLDSIGGNNINDDNVHNIMKNDYYENYNLWVTKGIVTEDFALTAQTNWADFVFEKDYKLPNLKEVASFIKANKHLPGIISKNDVQTKGYKLHDINVAFLEKIENLYLYSIEQEKEIAKYKEIISKHEARLNLIMSDLEYLKSSTTCQNGVHN